MVEYVRATDGLSIHFTQPNPANLALLHILRKNLDSVLNRVCRVLASDFEDIHLFLSIQHAQSLIDGAADVLLRPIWLEKAALQPTLDTKDNLLGILGVLGEVLVEQMQGVVLWGTVQLATIEEVGAQLDGLVESLEGLLKRGRHGSPCQTCGCGLLARSHSI